MRAKHGEPVAAIVRDGPARRIKLSDITVVDVALMRRPALFIECVTILEWIAGEGRMEGERGELRVESLADASKSGPDTVSLTVKNDRENRERGGERNRERKGERGERERESKRERVRERE